MTWRRWAREYHWQLAIPGRLILAPPIIGDGIGLAVLLIHWSFLRVSFPVSNIYIFVPLTSSASLSLSLSSTIVWPFNPLLCPLLWPLACPLAWIWYISRCFKWWNVIVSIIRSSYHGRIFVIYLAIAIVDSIKTNRWLLHRRVLHKLHPGGQEHLRPSKNREENLRRAWLWRCCAFLLKVCSICFMLDPCVCRETPLLLENTCCTIQFKTIWFATLKVCEVSGRLNVRTHRYI